MSNETQNARAATHYGHCQVCGSVQKLPKGLLSLHGYTLEYGFFNGTCSGSRHLPLEQSKDLIEDAIVRATREIEAIRTAQQVLRTQADDDTLAWVHAYVPAGYRNGRHARGGYRYMRVTLTAEVRHAGTDNEYSTYSYTRPDGKVERIQSYDAAATWDHPGADAAERRRLTILKLNAKYADTRLEREVQVLARYIAWQRDRVAAWHEQPLLPVKPKKDADAFDADAE